MRVAVVGGGVSGAAIRGALTARGAKVRMLSRTMGFDVLHDDVEAALAGVDAVVEASGRFTLSRAKATEFFTRSTRRIGRAAVAVGVRHVLLSIVNCDRPDLQGYGYFAAKAEQERTARSVDPAVRVLRSTQWFEFAQQNASRFGFGPIVLVPSMAIQPIALDAVAAVVADLALGQRADERVDVAGPDRTTLWHLTRAISAGRPLLAIPLPFVGRAGTGFRHGALLPEQGVEIHGPHLQDWLDRAG